MFLRLYVPNALCSQSPVVPISVARNGKLKTFPSSVFAHDEIGYA